MNAYLQPFRRSWCAVSCASALLYLAALGTAQASDYIVTSNADSGVGSLRDAINKAGDGDSVVFGFTTYPVTITLAIQINIDKSIAIKGPGATKLTIRSQSNDPLFQITNTPAHGATVISGVELREAVPATRLSSGEMHVVDVAFRNNGTAIFGGASIDVDRCIFDGNSQAIAWARSGGLLHITNSYFNKNNAYEGGAINWAGDAVIENSTFTNNHARASGGAIFADAEYGDYLIRNSTFVNNQADGSIGSINGGGAIAFGSNNTGPRLPDRIMTITASTIVNNTAGSTGRSGYGGGIYQNYGSIRLTNSVIANNAAANGGNDAYTKELLSFGYNLVKDWTDAKGSLRDRCDTRLSLPADLPPGTDPGLAALRVTSLSPVPMMVPNAGSPLINAIPTSGGPCGAQDLPPSDARKVKRPQGFGADIGAVEFVPNDDRLFCDGAEGSACTSLTWGI